MPKHITDFVQSKGISQTVYHNLNDVLLDTHVLYMTRIQRERFETQEEYDKVNVMILHVGLDANVQNVLIVNCCLRFAVIMW